MGVYNGARYLQEAVESILAQTFSGFEFLIVDDGSLDASSALLQGYAKRDKRVRVLRNIENIGLTKSLNRGIKAAQGKYIARMDADDISRPERFRKQIAFLEARPAYGLVGSWYVKINEHGRELWRGRPPLQNSALKKALIVRNPFPHASLMIRRHALEDVGPYNESWAVSQDYELLFRISSKYKIGVVPEFLFSSRVLSSSVTNTRNREQILAAFYARKAAIQRGQYPKFAFLFCLLALSSFLLPISWRLFLKRLM